MNPETAKRYPKNWTEISETTIVARGRVCQECGRSKRQVRALTVHHIDGCPENCSEDNLIVLCQGCHLRLQGTGRTLTLWAKAYQMEMF